MVHQACLSSVALSLLGHNKHRSCQPRTRPRLLPSLPAARHKRAPTLARDATEGRTGESRRADTEAAVQLGATPPPFSWARSWYPLAAVEGYLDPAKPTGVTVLGHNLVVWRDPGGTWRCFRDLCPHRAAPLSEGAVNPHTGNLECAYHGWQFSGSGECEAIPQSEPGPALETATASRRSCALSYPTALSHGILWVWLEPTAAEGAEGRAAAAPLPPAAAPAVDGSGRPWFEVSPWYVRDLEVDYLPLLENSADPYHVHFTHAGFIGAPERAGPVVVKRVGEGAESNSGVLSFVVEDPKRASFRELTLRPPCMLWASSGGNIAGGDLALLYFVVPVAPGRSRLFSLPLATLPAFRPLARVFHALPWLRHLYNHTVSAQDTAILHRQGTNMAAADWPGWRKGFYMPSPADGGVAQLRRWVEGTEGGGVAWGPNVDPGQPREAAWRRDELFNNWEDHTRHCRHCSKALKQVQAARTFAAAAAATCALGFVYQLARTGAAAAALPAALLGAGALAALALREALRRLERGFYFTEWHHADNKKLLAV